MSVWRKKAIDCAPELKNEFERSDLTLYSVFAELLPILLEAHRRNENERLKKIYDFAEWCFRQKDPALWNPAGVSFYEHLGDSEETFRAITTWVKEEMFLEIRGLLQMRISDEQLGMLDSFYGWKEPSKRRHTANKRFCDMAG